VKTRLAAEVGDERALALYRSVGGQVVSRVAASYPLTVWYDPPDARDEMREWLGDHEFSSQAGADLGARMAHAFETHFRRGDTPVIVIGADAPGVGAATIREAERALAGADAVIGPALDGGYYLLGLNAPAAGIFEGVPWDTDGVFEVTVALCRQCHLEVKLLAPLRDLDTAADLRALGLERT
jgi:rSAM/selenodomain-associated transferase 1